MQKKKYIWRICAVLLAFLAWQCVAMGVHSSILLVTPVAVFRRLLGIWREPGFWSNIWFSFRHITIGFLLGLASGVALAALSARYPAVEILLWPWMASVRSVPVASFVVISLIWLSNRRLSVFISFLVVVPVIYQNMLTGFRAKDEKMEEMARIFHMRFSMHLRYLTIPRIWPYLTAACRVTLGMAWKAGVAAEIIGTPPGSIGKQIYLAKMYLDTDDLLAWTVIIVLLSILSGKLCMKLLELAGKRLGVSQ